MTSSIYRSCLQCGCTAHYAGFVEGTIPLYPKATIINARTSLKISGIRYEFRYRYFDYIQDGGSKECWRSRTVWHCDYCNYEWNTLERVSPRSSK